MKDFLSPTASVPCQHNPTTTHIAGPWPGVEVEGWMGEFTEGEREKHEQKQGNKSVGPWNLCLWICNLCPENPFSCPLLGSIWDPGIETPKGLGFIKPDGAEIPPPSQHLSSEKTSAWYSLYLSEERQAFLRQMEGKAPAAIFQKTYRRLD